MAEDDGGLSPAQIRKGIQNSLGFSSRAATDVTQDVLDEADSSSSSSSRNSKQAKQVVRNIAWIGAVVVGVAIAVGTISVEFSPVLGGAAFAAMVGLAYALNANDDSISISFALTMVAAMLLLAEYVAPGFVLDALPFEIPSGIDPVHFAVLVVLLVLTWWVIDIRLITRSGVKPETVAKRLSARIQNLVEAYVAMGRVAFLLGVGVGIIILNQMGIIAGDLAGYAAEVPYLVSNLGTILLGYLALGGDIPYVSQYLQGIPFLQNLGAVGFAFLTVLILGLAVGVKYAD